MKLMSTFLFLVVAGLQMYVGAKQQEWQIERLKGSTRGTLGSYFASLGMLLGTFFQFWILTRVFPLRLILLLTGISVIGTLIYLMVGAVSGFTLKQNQQKIGVLILIWSFQRGAAAGCLFLGIGFLLYAVIVIGSLWVFWSHSIGDAYAKVLIALFLFVLPQLTALIASILASWPTVTSEYLDDDVRNSYLASSFSAMVSGTIFLLFPIWLFREEIHERFSGSEGVLTSFWLLLSIPFLLFILGSLLPFFVGLYRYRSQSRLMLNWQEKWLKELWLLNKLPVGEARSSAVDAKLNELENEIRTRASENEVLELYERLLMSPGSGQAAEEQPPDVFTVFAHNVVEIIKTNQEHLADWDIRFDYLSKLYQLLSIAPDAKSNDISAFIDGRIQTISQNISGLTPRKNILAGALLSLLSTAPVWLLKTFENQLVDLVGKLVKLPG